MNLKHSIIKNLFSGGFGKASTVVIRLIQVPLLLSALGVTDYGIWLVLSSLPAWLTMANLGFGSVAANEITMLTASANYKKANEIYATTLALISFIAVVGIVVVSVIVPFVDWKTFFKESSLSNSDFSFILILLASNIFISFFNEVFASRFRAAQKYYISILLNGLKPWLDLLGVLIVIYLGVGFMPLAISMTAVSIIFVLANYIASKLVYKQINFSIANVNKVHYKFLFSKGIAFQAFPLGNALLYQGSLLVIQSILGPAAVALFGTARTLVRSVNQLMELINQAIWPELSYVLGAKDYLKARKLHRMGVIASVALAIAGTAFLLIFGQSLYSFWTGNALQLNTLLLFLFLVPIPFNALWFTSSVVHVACNQHEKLAINYLIATTLSIVACIAFSYIWGIQGAALSTLVADIVLIPFVFRKSLRLTEDSLSEFFKISIFDYATIRKSFLHK